MADLPHVFISYKSDERDKANLVRDILIKENIPVWMDCHNIVAADDYGTSIIRALKSCGCVVLIHTKLAHSSKGVYNEIEKAFKYKKKIVVIKLDETELDDEPFPGFDYFAGSDQAMFVSEISEKNSNMQRVISSVKNYVGFNEDNLNKKEEIIENKEEKKEIEEKTETKEPVISKTETSATDFEYEIKNNEVIINKYIGKSKEVIIPAKIKGKKVTSIGNNSFSICYSLTSIQIPDSVTSIGDSAFWSCIKLTSVTFGENIKLTSIGSWAFYYCISLTSIEIPSSVTSIGSWAFDYCSSLTSIEIPNSVTSIGCYAFYDCSSLKSIVIPSNVEIEESVFERCNKLNIFSKERKEPWYWKRGWNPEKRPVYYEGEWEYVNGVPTPKK